MFLNLQVFRVRSPEAKKSSRVRQVVSHRDELVSDEFNLKAFITRRT
jgi:hypothetical protein